MSYGYQATGNLSAASAIPNELKGTAVDSINANIEGLTNRANTLAQFTRRISDGILGVEPQETTPGKPQAITQSTQDHIRDLESAFERLSAQINRLG
jgi:hypothetical protein